MIKIKKKTAYIALIFTLAFIALIFLQVDTASAHRLIIEEEEAGLVKLSFDDGGQASEVKIVLETEAGEIVEEGYSDEEGYYEYSPETEAQKMIADDGMGHRAVLVFGQGQQTSLMDSLPLWFRTMGGILLILVIAAFYYIFKKTRRGEQ
ncbi:hypothetical protein LJ207_09165 [Halanaerobium sp. Z-7514]|uniref:Uncharacterized protein n=1 Tax=Halanaerobium polyolivorans TaxID=2886943 RepID=A0AAW4X107_9FIRM|nr:hypothetical protein [Halanaerobium polyolivorans]MCC3145491.1 hypothetical protein [Halanaerobium polyolivorans]